MFYRQNSRRIEAMKKSQSLLALKPRLLLIWAAWFTVVFATNVCDGLTAAGFLPSSWSFASGNFRFVSDTTARYGVPNWLNAVLFIGVIGWEGIAALLF